MSWAIKVYGERNSGTNYLEKLIEENLDVEVIRIQRRWFHMQLLKLIRYDFIQDIVEFLQRKEVLGWKHGCPRIKEIKRYKKQKLAVITITKNPYAYLLSLHRNPYHLKGRLQPNFVAFLKQPWLLRRRDRLQKRQVDSPIDLWNLKNREYLELKNRVENPVFNLSYESLIENPEQIISDIASTLRIDLKNSCFKNIEPSTKHSGKSFGEYRDYYLNQQYENELSVDAVKVINQQLDRPVLSHFNYKILQESSTVGESVDGSTKIDTP